MSCARAGLAWMYQRPNKHRNAVMNIEYVPFHDLIDTTIDVLNKTSMDTTQHSDIVTEFLSPFWKTGIMLDDFH